MEKDLDRIIQQKYQDNSGGSEAHQRPNEDTHLTCNIEDDDDSVCTPTVSIFEERELISLHVLLARISNALSDLQKLPLTRDATKPFLTRLIPL
jgi:hypothetical protein